ncbi:MAG TPA: hypothetical protein VGL90_12010, partial [Casimicrobiaceae bacterium]
MKRTLVAVAVTAALCTGGALAQTPAAPAKTAPKAAAAAAKPATATSSDKVLYNQAQYDLVLKEQIAQGQKDTPELRNAIKDRLNMVQLLAGEAKKQGIDKNADVRNQMDINAQQILASAYISDWLKKNPVPEADMRKEYDQIKSQIGDKEYKVRH